MAIEFDTRTKLCGVIGNPVDHSLSPAIHNAAFRKAGLNFVYLAFPVEAIGDALKGIRSLGNTRGFSVTIPHKVAAMPFLDEVDHTARQIGAINTIVVENGKLKGYNTDASGALRALRENGAALLGQRVLLLGSGGAARAIAFALAADAQIAGLTILGVDEAERMRLVQDLRSRTTLAVEDGPIQDDALRRWIPHCRTVIHCTPVGMFPHNDETCVPAAMWRSDLTVMDIVYNPRETRLLKEAKAAGCRTIQGIEMFLNQAVLQFELWTNEAAPADVMRAVLESRFQ
ncbi:MAG TPA: shikimate dehydrogenase [Nitrospiraceae bacterium]|nr:shikimate dehydrogenase [Nitrospiraceae bacterium]